MNERAKLTNNENSNALQINWISYTAFCRSTKRVGRADGNAFGAS